MQLEKRVHDDTKVCQPSLSPAVHFRGKHVLQERSQFDDRSTIVRNRAERVFRSLARKGKRKEKDHSLIYFSRGCFTRSDNSHPWQFSWMIIRRRNRIGPRSAFPPEPLNTARVTLLLLTRGWIPILSSCSSRSSRFHRDADIEERREIVGISRHLLTKRARSLRLSASHARPSLYATRPFAFVLTPSSSLFSSCWRIA